MLAPQQASCSLTKQSSPPADEPTSMAQLWQEFNNLQAFKYFAPHVIGDVADTHGILEDYTKIPESWNLGPQPSLILPRPTHPIY